MNIQVMGHESKSRSVKVTLTAEDLTQAVANTAQEFDTCELYDGDIVESLWVNNKVAFKDADDAAFNSNTVIIGDNEDDDRYLAAAQLNENGTEIGRQLGIGAPYIYSAGNRLKVKINSMTAKSLANIDTGELEIFADIRSTEDY